MKKVNRMMFVGITGLLVSSIILSIAYFLDRKFDFFTIMMPFFVFLIMGWTNKKQYVKD